MRAATLLIALLLAGCSALFLHPSERMVRDPAQIGLRYEDVRLAAPDGAVLRGWYLPAAGPARGTVLHLHGNAENISTFIGAVHWLPARGYNVLLLDYRGFGESGGEPSIDHVNEDARVALDWLLARPGADSERLVVFGQSLGGSAAIYAVAHHPQRERVRAVISEGAFSSYSRIAREKLDAFWLTWPLQWPLSLLFSDRYAAERAAPLLDPVPLLVMHGEQDPVVPVTHSRRLFDAAKGPRELWTLPGGHIEALTHPENRERFAGYLDRYTGAVSAAAASSRPAAAGSPAGLPASPRR
jgi:fermentation-respiration switch protein FrsA (DUF1100 family)